MAGRPRGFDRDEALEAAMHLFWTQGYTATSLHNLLAEMGIGRQSLYDTFGSKHALFIEALRAYDEIVIGQTQALLEAPGSPLENLKGAVQLWSERACQAPRRGCLINNSVTELSLHDPAIAEIVKAHFTKLEGLLQRTLERALAEGERSAATDPAALARFLAGTCHGLIVLGKAGVEQAKLQDVAAVAVSLLA